MGVNIAQKATTELPSWLKSGAAANQGLAAEEQRIATAKEAASKMRRFWLNAGDEKEVTFLDGALDPSGALKFLAFHEHTVQHNGQWDNRICTKDVEPCPICNGGDKPAYVGVLTVIVHTPYTVQKGPNAGKVLKDFRQLYVARYTTLQNLRHFATKRNGLNGWRVEIARMTDKDPRSGSAFQFMERKSPEELAALYGDESVPADYATELTFMSAAEMNKIGLGVATKGPGYEKPMTMADAADLM